MLETGVRDAILRAVDERSEEVVAHLQRLIQIDSVTGREGEIQRFLASTLEEMGLKVDVWEPNLQELASHPAYIPIEGLDFRGRPNVVGLLEGDPGARSLLLNGHIDTINYEPLSEWVDPPLSGLVKDGKVYGRGASDMKGGVAAMTMALKILLDAGYRPKGKVILEYMPDEEVSGYGTLSAIVRGYKADAGICPETSDMCVQPGCIGRMWFFVEVTGKSLSVSSRWEAVDAIEKGMRIIQAVQDWERMRIDDLSHPLYPDIKGAVASAVCMFEAGTFPTAVPGRALLTGSVGLLPSEEPKDIQAQFRAHIERVAQVDPWLRKHPPKVWFKDIGSDGAEIPMDHPIVQTVAEAYECATGSKPTINGRRGGADTRYLIKYGQTPMVIFGPGVTAQMHALNEWVPVSNLIQATKAIALAIYDWCR